MKMFFAVQDYCVFAEKCAGDKCDTFCYID